MTADTDAAISRMRHTSDVIVTERARLFGSAMTLADTVGLTNTLTILDSTKARLVASRSDKEDWVA